MSLIQEALRRREEEDGRRPETPGDRIVPAPEAEVPAAGPAAGRSRKEWLALLSVLVVVLVVSVCAVGLLIFIARTLPKLAAQHPAPAASTPVAPPEEELSAAGESQVKASAGSATAAESVAAASAPEAVAVTEAREAPEPEAEVVTADTGSRSGEGAQESPPPAETTEGEPAASAPGEVSATVPASRTAVDRVAEVRRVVSREERRPAGEEMIWPVLQVSGIIRQAGGVAAAIVNGRLVSKGDRVDGADIVAVEMSGVWVEFKGQRKFVRVGGSLTP